MTTHHNRQHQEVRRKITAAAIAGIFAGVARAVTTWLVETLTTGN